jgi:16S rRNA (uracil1498-N3)-methyltransferase
MHIFYSFDIEDDIIKLCERESSHAFKVLRLKSGSRVVVLDGKGSKYECEIINDNAKHGVVRIISKHFFRMNHPGVEIAIAPTKLNDRFEWFLEKATELGVAVIVPVFCDRSERRVLNMDRIRKVIIAAMKQSMNPNLPDFEDCIDVRDYLNRKDDLYVNLEFIHIL